MTKDEQRRIEWIKLNLNTRNTWSKQDYSDFYYRDITLLLGIIDRGVSQQADTVDKKNKGTSKGYDLYQRWPYVRGQ